MKQGGSGRLGIAEYLALEICAGSTNLNFMVLSSYSSDYGIGKLGQAESQGEWESGRLWKARINIWLLWDKSLYLCAQSIGSGSGDRHSSREAGNSSFLTPVLLPCGP